jgi:hypothetical protein
MVLPEDELRRRTTATAFRLFGLAKLFGEARAPG